jgi:hypothetical protein
MGFGFRFLLLWLLIAASGSAGWAQQLSSQQMRGLDEQVQDIKTDVLRIAAELGLLEEKLLYPSHTQVALFVGLREGERFRLDAVHIHINGKPVAHHIYSYKELEALQKGGVQRIYTGNLATGEHELAVSVVGKHESGRDYTRTEQFRFTKDVTPTVLGITLTGSDRDGIRIGHW